MLNEKTIRILLGSLIAIDRGLNNDFPRQNLSNMAQLIITAVIDNNNIELTPTQQEGLIEEAIKYLSEYNKDVLDK